MKLFEGKTKSERNKTIAAIGLGAASIIVLFFAFGRGMFGGGTSSATAKPSPTPKKSTTTAQSTPGKLEMPSQQERELSMMVPIRYDGSLFDARPAGRNIFAFYEPPKPCTTCPTPPPRTPEPPPPTPAPTPPIILAAVNPQSVYAGSNGFRMEIAGDRFTPDTKIYFEQQEIPAAFINETRMTADIPKALIGSDGRRTILAQTADGTKISNPILFDIQPPPKPSFKYIGSITRKRSNNDFAYFLEPGKQIPTRARLNDVVGGRFRLISVSEAETILEDVNLGFKHKLKMETPPATAGSSQPGLGQPGRGFPSGGAGREVYTPGSPGVRPPGGANTRVPMVPEGVPRYLPPASNTNRNPQPTKQQNEDEDDDGIDK